MEGRNIKMLLNRSTNLCYCYSLQNSNRGNYNISFIASIGVEIYFELKVTIYISNFNYSVRNVPMYTCFSSKIKFLKTETNQNLFKMHNEYKNN